MDVADSDCVASTVGDEVCDVLAAFERATGLQACFRPLSDRWRDADGRALVGELFHMHRSSFCVAVKAHDEPACMRCDFAELPAACAPPQGRRVEPFVRTCHAGADELLLPLWSEGMLVAVVFVGQFTRPGRAGKRRRNGLRRLDAAQVADVRTLMLTLRSYLQDVLRGLDEQRERRASGRRGTIERYVRERLSSGPTLAGLASRLALSPSRASHAVREETGRSFRELVAERRIAVAQDLLTSTDGTIAWVALQTGFNDVGYFCRYFKRKAGTTPTAFRRRYRRVVSA